MTLSFRIQNETFLLLAFCLLPELFSGRKIIDQPPAVPNRKQAPRAAIDGPLNGTCFSLGGKQSE